MPRGNRHTDLPASNDPIWFDWAGDVLSALDRPKTTEQLKDWARSEKFEIGRLFNALAWLDMRGLVEFEKEGTKPLWKRLPEKSLSPSPTQRHLAPPPSACPRCHGRMKAEPERFACVTCGHSIYPPAEAGDDY